MNFLRMVAVGLLLGATAACGDNRECPEVFVVITSPTADVTQDSNVTSEGVQTDVRVRSNLSEGVEVTLTVVQGGADVSTVNATVDAAGDIRFTDVTVPTGDVTLRVTGVTECGTGTDEVTVFVGNRSCVVTIRETPTANDFYGVPVLNTSHDTDAATAGFQGNVDVMTTPGNQVELFVTDTDETSQGTETAGSDGTASFAVSLVNGQNSVRAICSAPGGGAGGSSLATVVFVDTVAPDCTVEPAAGTTIIPSMDTDSGTPDTQIVLRGHSDATDVEGEEAQFVVNGTNVTTPALDANGDTSVTATFDTPSPPDTPVVFSTQDHAANTCEATRSYRYQIDGCPITITDPAGSIATDADGTPGNGLQYDLEVDVGAACEGRTVTTDCSVTGNLTGTVPAGGGAVTIRVTLCTETDGECQGQRNCVATVTDPANLTTTDGVTLNFDTLPPPITLDLLQPPTLQCGRQYDPSIDYDGNAGNGVQIRVRASDLGQSAMRWIEFTPEGGATQQIAVNAVTGQADVTLPLNGAHLLQAVAEDLSMNQARNPVPACAITLSDLAVTFDPPVDDGVIGVNDPGVTVGASDVTLDICGTVSDPSATVDLVIDGGTAIAASVVGTAWCVSSVTLTEGDHVVTANATTGGATGVNTLNPLTVDLTPPDSPTGLAVTQITHASADVAWTSPQNGGASTPAASYEVRFATTPINDGNFSSTGTVLTPPTPSTPGQTDRVTVTDLRPGTQYYFAVAAYDAVGNRSMIAASPAAAPGHTFDYVSSGPVDPYVSTSFDAGWHQLGYAVAGGDLNNDGFGDLIVGSPWTDATDNTPDSTGDGLVYVYLGKTDGTGVDTSEPTFIIQPTAGQNGNFGIALVTLDWNGDLVDDLAVGAPFQNGFGGRVAIFLGGSGFDPGAMATPVTINQSTAADFTIQSDGAGTFFSFARLGWSLAAGRFDADGNDDLVIGVIGAQSNKGGALVVHGGTTEFGLDDTVLRLSDTDTSEMGNARVQRIRFASEAGTPTYGFWTYNLGRTEGVADTTDDFAIVPFSNSVMTRKVFVYRGRAALPAIGLTDLPFSAAVDLAVTDDSTTTPTTYGQSVSTVRDLNGDGAREIVIADGRAAGGGYVSFVDGNAVGTQAMSAVQVSRITGSSPIFRFGTGMANNWPPSASDVDGDGVDDLVLTGRQNTPGGLHAYTYIVYSDALPTSGTVTANATVGHRIPGPGPQGDFELAQTAAWVGDLNNDGLSDICWADYEWDPTNGTDASPEIGRFALLDR